MGIKTQIKAKDLESNNQFNISLLGFKMAITEGLTVFNLVDGIVDEFEDESGTDASASTSLTYNSTDDYYINSTQPDGLSTPAVSAGFAFNSVTEPDTSVVQSQCGAHSEASSSGTFTVPSGVTSLNFYAWGSGGGGGADPEPAAGTLAGGGGFVSGALAVSSSQVLHTFVGNGGQRNQPAQGAYGVGGTIGGGSQPGTPGNGGGGGGLSFIGSSPISTMFVSPSPGNNSYSAPDVIVVAGAGGGSSNQGLGGAGGGTTGQSGGFPAAGPAQTSANSLHGGGGGQSSGGQGGPGATGSGSTGGFLQGGNGSVLGASGGGGYYGGGGAGYSGPQHGGGGGGSSYIGHPQITCAVNEGGASDEGGGVTSPLYVAGTNESGPTNRTDGEKGYILYTASAVCASTTSSTIISDPFTANTVPTTSRIVVFEENVGTPTLNTDIIASVSRNGGTNFTTVTLTDSGYVTGASGQRILTGQADISGQPSGQSMKWKLQLANQTVKIHGVSLQWS